MLTSLFARVFALLLGASEARAISLLEAAPVTRVMRSDFAPPESLVLTYTRAWTPSLKAILEAAAPTTQILLLEEKGETGISTFLHHLAPEVRSKVKRSKIVVDTAWARDYSPLEVRELDASETWIDSRYIAGRPLDDRAATEIGAALGKAVVAEAMPLDGGAISSDGAGFCVSTREFFARVGVDPSELGPISHLQQRIGCPTLLLVSALTDEPTAHVDLFVQFISPTVAIVAEIDPVAAPEDSARLDQTARALAASAELRNQALTVVRVPMGIDRQGRRMSYVNGLRLADVFLVPRYAGVDRKVEAKVIDRISEALAGVPARWIPATEIGELGGGLHCVAVGL